VRAGRRPQVFPQIPNEGGGHSPGTPKPHTGPAAGRPRPREHAAPRVRAGYHSPVCSNTGDAIDRIAAAIDQLASEARDAGAGAAEGELTMRIAAIWQMISDIDPELARRAQRYTGLVDDGPSA
jgi:hypothetical protein